MYIFFLAAALARNCYLVSLIPNAKPTVSSMTFWTLSEISLCLL